MTPLFWISLALAEAPVPADPASATAETAGAAGLSPTVTSRTQVVALSDYPVDAEGNTVGQPLSVQQRLRLALESTWNDLLFATEWDVLAGQVAGDVWSIEGTADERNRQTLSALSLDGVVPRRASVKGTSSIGQWEVGLVPSHWGLGMVANDGAHEKLFGQGQFGDRVFRARLTAQPSDGDGTAMPVYVSLGVDRVLADDMARMSEGQEAWQALASALYKNGDLSTGFYAVVRNQQEPAEEGEIPRDTFVSMLDATVSVPMALGELGWGVVLDLEAAGVVGQTDRATSYNTPEQVRINSGAAAARLRIRSPEDRAILHVRGGFASGDGLPDDGVSTTFTMDRDFDAGLVLFHELLGSVDAATHALLSDPERSGQPPDGLDTLTAEGALRGAAYAQPVLQVQAGDRLDLRLGGMMAWSTAPVRQAFYSYRAGGVNRNHHNQPAGGNALGSEVDWGVGGDLGSLTVAKQDLAFQAQIQGGHAFLSDQLAGQGVDRVHLGLATLHATW